MNTSSMLKYEHPEKKARRDKNNIPDPSIYRAYKNFIYDQEGEYEDKIDYDLGVYYNPLHHYNKTRK
jgi:hypothetical protein